MMKIVNHFKQKLVTTLRENTSNMSLYYIFSSMIMGVTLSQSTNENSMTLFDFTTTKNVNNWAEISDTVREVGMSKATLTLQKTQVFQRGIFFTLLNPQPNGAGFAGVRVPVNWNLTDYQNIEMSCRGQGNNEHYKIVLRHNGESSNTDITYENFFNAPMSSDEFSTVICPLSDFKAYYRGKISPDSPPLNTENITMFGLQVYGGVYSPIKQKGVSALEIKKIIATR